MNYTEVKNPVWGNAEKTAILCDVTFEEIGAVPFGAVMTDVEAHGREIFARAAAGEFGPIGDYVAPVVPPEPSVDVAFGGATVKVTAAVHAALVEACYMAVVMGDTMVTIKANGADVTGFLGDARAAIRAFKSLSA